MRLKLKQLRFIEFYTDPDNKKTYGNATQSAKEAYGYTNDNVAAVTGCNLLRNPKIEAKVTEILEKNDV